MRFIAVTEENEAIVAPFLKRREMKGWVGLDTDQSVTKLYANEIFPTTVVIDRNSKIVEKARPKRVTEQMLNDLLNGTTKDVAQNNGNGPTPPIQKPAADTQAKRILSITIQLAKPDENNWAIYPGNFKGQMTLRTALSIIYDVPETLIIGPSMLNENRYDITATMTEGDKTALKSIIEKAIESSFKLKVHRETQDAEVLVLTVPDESKIKLRTKSLGTEHWSSDEGVFAASAAPIKRLVDGITGLLSQPVVDETNLKGKYDWDIVFDAKNYESIIDALRRDVGLELKRGKRKVEVVVVEPVSQH